MFERFTKSARGVVVEAQEVARRLGAGLIDTRHLMLGLLAEPGELDRALERFGLDGAELAAQARARIARDGLDPEALAAVGIDLAQVTRRTDELFGSGALHRAGRGRGHLRFGRDAKKALELALREAVALGDRSIETRHVALGILRAECPGRELLESAGVDVRALRAALQEPRAKSA